MHWSRLADIAAAFAGVSGGFSANLVPSGIDRCSRASRRAPPRSSIRRDSLTRSATLLPGVAYGTVAGTVKTAKDVVQGMSKAMSGMGYYIVMAFFAALFTADFGRSNLGALFALKGATLLQALQLPGQVPSSASSSSPRW